MCEMKFQICIWSLLDYYNHKIRLTFLLSPTFYFILFFTVFIKNNCLTLSYINKKRNNKSTFCHLLIMFKHSVSNILRILTDLQLSDMARRLYIMELQSLGYSWKPKFTHFLSHIFNLVTPNGLHPEDLFFNSIQLKECQAQFLPQTQVCTFKIVHY